MTATAAALAFGPIVASAPRAQPQAPTDRFAFAAVLDSLPGAEAKAGSSVDGDQSPTSNEPKQGEESLGQPDFHSILSSLPFAFLPASAPHEGAVAAAEASALAPASTLGLRPEDNGASNVADADPANPAAVGRLVGERAFHLSLSTSGNVLAERPPTVGPLALAPTPASSQGAGAPIGPPALAPTAASSQGAGAPVGPPAFAPTPASSQAGGAPVGRPPASSQGAGAPVGPPALAPTAASSQAGGAPIGPSSLAPLSTQGQALVGEGAPSAVGAASASASVGASRIGERVLLANLPSARSATAMPLAEAAPSWSETSASAPIAPRVNGSSANPSASVTRPAAQSPAHGGRKSEVAASPSLARPASSAAPAAPAEPSGKAADGSPDPTPSGVQSAAPGSAFGAPPSASLAQGPSFGSYDVPAGAADVAPRASALSAPRTTAAPPVKEIDVDLSPSGLEDASMTMRLAGDKLSVVIRTASSHTYGSIEGARDAIADRLAAIGQPLDSLIIQQVGGNADANTNGNAAADEGSTAGEGQSRQSAGEQAGSNDPSASRRGASGDLRF